jgi:hypothetical protein
MGFFVHLGGLRFVEIKTPEAGFVQVLSPVDIYEAAKFGVTVRKLVDIYRR